MRPDKTVPTDFLVQLMSKVLSCNIFEFDGTLYKQIVGTAMGTPSAVNYSNLFMNKIDLLLEQLAAAKNYGIDPFLIFKRFIDDIFSIYVGLYQNLLNFLNEINNPHPTIKFTYSMTCPFRCEYEGLPHDCFCHGAFSLPFLDTLVTLRDNKISTDLYKKETDRCQYLLPSSCHPAHITKNIPFSLGFRLLRIVSDPDIFLRRLEELKELLLSRKYNVKFIDAAFSRLKLLKRADVLKKVVPVPNNRIVFTVDYHPALPNISSITRKSWNLMIKEPRLKQVFPNPPLTAYRRPKSLRDILIRAKVPPKPTRRSNRSCLGMKKCNSANCNVCPYIMETDNLKSTQTKFTHKICSKVNCLTENLIYLITCTKCKQQYIGQTGRKFKCRLNEHISYVKNNVLTQPTGFHFNQPGHDVSFLQASIVEKCNYNEEMYRLERETMYINLFDSKNKGMNKKL